MLLTLSERKRAAVLLCMILIMASLDMLGVASILPFIAVLANPELVQTNSFLNMLFSITLDLGIQKNEQFIFALGVLVFVLLVVSLAFKALTTHAQIQFALMQEYRIGKRLVKGYLHQPYSSFLNRHSADLGKFILSEVGEVIGKGIVPLITLIAQSAVTLAMITLLLLVDPELALSVGLVLGSAYFCIFVVLKGRLKRLGQERVKANQDRFTAVIEAFGGIKEVKISGLERAYTARFSKPAEIYARGQSVAQSVALLPRFALEAVAFGGMLLLLLYLIANSGGLLSALPILSLYALAGYRMMPALQQIYHASVQLRFASPALGAMCQELAGFENEVVEFQSRNRLHLASEITLRKVNYQYPNVKNLTLKDIDITIPVSSIVGFVGMTGSGKTTTVDVLLGLLEPLSGCLSVDGQRITTSQVRQWQNNIGYVPQNIYLSDDSVSANIAFGLQPQEVDQKAVERAAKIADLHEFVTSELPQGYATTVGERGVRLSGGQRQRIGIARALYHNPQVLILDEATSALDNLTEQAVMKAINHLGKEITIILIAHRLSTVRECDLIYLMKGGRVKACGTYDELISNSPEFASMAGFLGGSNSNE